MNLLILVPDTVWHPEPGTGRPQAVSCWPMRSFIPGMIASGGFQAVRRKRNSEELRNEQIV